MSRKAERKPDSEAYVPSNCECGSKGGAYLVHYGLMRCSCGRMHWALQPDRLGPLILFPWPGLQKKEESK